jgi:glycosyltransferase involved in cell wall biosynthesis
MTASPSGADRRPGSFRRRPRVLYLIDRVSTIGGAERFATGLAAALPQERFEPWICSTRYAREDARRLLAEAGVGHLHLGRDATWQLHRLAPLVALLRSRRFDVLHAHMFGSNLWGALLGRSLGVPVVIAHEHNWSFQGRPLRVALDRGVIAPLATRMVTVSGASAQMMIEREGISADKLIVMPTASVPRAPAGDAGEGAQPLPDLPAGIPVIAVAAVLRREKALDVLIAAHRLVLEAVPEARLLIAGDGPCRTALEQQIARLGLGERVSILGVRSDVHEILARADLGVLSSDWEGMPLFALECMQLGVPLVATAVGGLPELVEDGVSGRLVAPRDPAALAQAIIALLGDPPRRGQLAAAARERVRELSIEHVAGRFADLYDELLEEAAER